MAPDADHRGAICRLLDLAPDDEVEYGVNGLGDVQVPARRAQERAAVLTALSKRPRCALSRGIG